jgi:hypothetical protein
MQRGWGVAQHSFVIETKTSLDLFVVSGSVTEFLLSINQGKYDQAVIWLFSYFNFRFLLRWLLTHPKRRE